MRTQLLYILIFAFLAVNVHAQDSNSDNADSGKAKPANDTVKTQLHAAGRRSNNVSKADVKQKKENTIKSIFNELNNVMSRLEQLNKQIVPGLHDSTYVLIETSQKKEKSPVIIRLKITDADNSSTPFQSNLILDSIGYLAGFLSSMKDSVKHFEARLTDNNKELSITLRKPGSEQVASYYNAGNENAVQQSKTSGNKNSGTQSAVYWIIVVAGVLLLLWAINRFFHARSSKKLTMAKREEEPATTPQTVIPPSVEQPEPMAEAELKNEDHPGSFTDRYTTGNTLPVKAEDEPVAERPAIPVTNYASGFTGRYFLSEIMITAGPRKKYISEPDADKDLGEDVCGFISNGNNLLLWLLDGTSDLYCLKNPDDNREYFSSRLLAQGIAGKLRPAVGNLADTSLDSVIAQAIRQVKADWLAAIDKLSDEEKAVIKANIEAKNIPECATTLLIGQLSINGDLIAYRSGDSKMVLFNTLSTGSSNHIETSLAHKNEVSNDRLFFRLCLDAEGKIDIYFNVPNFEIIKQQNVSTLIAFSDGVGMQTELLLKQQNNIQLDEIRDEIIYHTQGTADDKSICFIEIKESGNKHVEQYT